MQLGFLSEILQLFSVKHFAPSKTSGNRLNRIIGVVASQEFLYHNHLLILQQSFPLVAEK